jgi:C1A family cysteine protease
MKLALVALAVLFATSAFFGAKTRMRTLTFHDDSAIDQAFNTWLQTQNKLYLSPSEKNYRRNVFSANYHKVAELNKVHFHKSELNKFADLTEEEFIIKYTGLRYTGNEVRSPIKHSADSLGQQASVDWRTQGAVNPVKDQGQCGSCWAFAATSAIESSVFLKSNVLYDLSEQQMVDCGGSTGNYGCNGGFMDYAFQYIMKVGGQELTSDYPYTARDGRCKFQQSLAKASIKSFVDVDENDCKGLVSALNKQPVSVGIAANAIMFYSSGIFSNSACGTQLNHGVVAVGYGTEGDKNYYIVRNSWGAGWGEKGYIRMSRDVQTSSGICGICMAASYPTASDK